MMKRRPAEHSTKPSHDDNLASTWLVPIVMKLFGIIFCIVFCNGPIIFEVSTFNGLTEFSTRGWRAAVDHFRVDKEIRLKSRSCRSTGSKRVKPSGI